MKTRRFSRRTVIFVSPEPARRGYQGALWINFVISVWALIAYCLFRSVYNLVIASALHDAYGPFSVRVALAPVVVGIMEGLLWFKPFRGRQSGARVMATFMGIVVSIFVFILLMIASLYGRDLDPLRIGLGVYVALSHLAFGIFGRESGS